MAQPQWDSLAETLAEMVPLPWLTMSLVQFEEKTSADCHDLLPKQMLF